MPKYLLICVMLCLPVFTKQGIAVERKYASGLVLLSLTNATGVQFVTDREEPLDLEGLALAFQDAEAFVLQEVERRLIQQLENSNQIRQRTAAYLLTALEALNADNPEATISELQVLQKKHRDLIENADTWFAHYLLGAAFRKLEMPAEARTFFSKSLMQAVNMSTVFYGKVSLWHLYEIEMEMDHQMMAYEYLVEFDRLCQHQELMAIIDTSVLVEEIDTLQKADGYTAPSTNLRWRLSIILAILLASISFMVFYKNTSGILAFVIPAGLFSRSRPVAIPIDTEIEEINKPTWKRVFKRLRPKDDTKKSLLDEEIRVDEYKIDRLTYLRGLKLLTKEDWELFMGTFSEIYPDFLIRLHLKYAGVTQAEERLACLIRIHFVTRDIARTLGISAHSVNMSRYRLRKRLNLDTEDILEEYIMKL